jgi:hypothetical protein
MLGEVFVSIDCVHCYGLIAAPLPVAGLRLVWRPVMVRGVMVGPTVGRAPAWLCALPLESCASSGECQRRWMERLVLVRAA